MKGSKLASDSSTKL